MIKIYFSSYSKKLSDPDFYSYLNLLPPELEQKIMRFRRWEDRHASLYGKLLLMRGLEEAGFSADLIHLKYTTYGRPYLESTPDFNISHSGFFTVCAISFGGKIGVDIEEIKPAAICDFEEEFSKEEWNGIINSDNPNYWFYYYWTGKEAIAKANGGGLSLPLQKININDNRAIIGEKPWFLKSISIHNNYMLQIATDNTIQTEIDMSEIAF